MGGLEIPTRILLALKHVTQVAKKTYTSCRCEQVHGRMFANGFEVVSTLEKSTVCLSINEAKKFTHSLDGAESFLRS
jgi:hypothetical protein